MKKVNTRILKKGDIILTTSKKYISNTIKLFTWSDISHAMLYVAEGSVMDSTSEGVHARNIQKMFYKDNCAIYVLRLKEPLSSEKLDKIIYYIRSLTGTSYGTSEAVISVTKPKSKGSRKQFCSRLVAQAFATVGINLCENPDYCTPKQLKHSPLLSIIKNPSLPVTSDEEKDIEEIGDATVTMREVTNKLLSDMKKIDSSIEDIGDIFEVLIKNPHLDDKMATVFMDSGYLDFWEVEESKFPWRYDINSMLKFNEKILNDGGEGVINKYCHDTLKQVEEGTFNHWKTSLEGHKQQYLNYPLKTIKLQVVLYKNLNLQIYKKLKTAQSFLRIKGHL